MFRDKCERFKLPRMWTLLTAGTRAVRVFLLSMLALLPWVSSDIPNAVTFLSFLLYWNIVD